MKNIYSLFLLICIVCLQTQLKAQVGISATNTPPNASAMLDVSSTTKGFLAPRMNTSQRLAINPPVVGLLVFDTSTKSYWYCNFIYTLGGTTYGTWSEIPNKPLWELNGLGGNEITNTNTGGFWSKNAVTVDYNSPPTATAPTSGSGTRMMWIPSCSAFRAGTIDANNSTNWDATNIGLFSFASGFNTKANGNSSFAMGQGTTASGEGSIAFGGGSIASGSISTALGLATIASGVFSLATGIFTTASGNNATTMGSYTTASGESSIAMGYRTLSFGVNSTAIGDSSTSAGISSTAIGFRNYAQGVKSTAIGVFNYTIGKNSIALGYGNYTSASGANATSIGSGSNSSGINSISVGINSIASGAFSTAMGVNGNTNNKEKSFSIGGASSPSRATNDQNYQMKMHFDNFQFLTGTGNITEITDGLISTTNSLSVYGTRNINLGGYGYLNSAAGVGTIGAVSNPYAIYTNGRIAASEFNAFSDARHKKLLNYSKGSSDLALLNQLKVSNYTFIDTLGKGGELQMGFIAQEVEKIVPNAIKKLQDYIPNVYDMAERIVYNADAHTLTVTTKKPHDFRAKDEIKFISLEKEHKVKADKIIDAHTFVVNNWEKSVDKIFVFGKQVNDFRTVDYNRLFTLGISSIQELSRKIDALEQENLLLKDKNQEFNLLKKDVADLKAMLLK